jgi:hypothetical protein
MMHVFRRQLPEYIKYSKKFNQTHTTCLPRKIMQKCHGLFSPHSPALWYLNAISVHEAEQNRPKNLYYNGHRKPLLSNASTKPDSAADEMFTIWAATQLRY